MAKIFQLELFIQDITLWEVPKGGKQNEISIDVTVFGCHNVPIKRHGSDENGKAADTMNRGQNFLFTLNEIPADENKVFFNIHRIANQKKLVGTGKIPIHELFGDVFLESFRQPVVVEQPKDAVDDSKVKDASKTAQPQNQTTKNDSKRSQQNLNKKRKSSVGKGTATNSKSGNNQQQQKTGDATKNDTAADVVPTENAFIPPCFPITKLTKDIYPVIDTDPKQCGTVCILMRLTSFGNSSAHPIHIHQNHKEIIIQNSQNTALYRRLPLDELRNNRHSEDFRFISAFPSNAGKNELTYKKGPGVKDLNTQCNEKEILKDILERQKS